MAVVLLLLFKSSDGDVGIVGRELVFHLFFFIPIRFCWRARFLFLGGHELEAPRSFDGRRLLGLWPVLERC